MIKVVCGIINKNDKILVCRIKSEKKLGGYWEFPGGKIESNENAQEALERELVEELDMKVNVLSYFATSVHKYEKFTIELIAYKCEFIEANFKLSDHDKYEWKSVDQIINMKLAPADIPIAEKLMN